MGRKPFIDHDECIADGVCESICPEVFELRDDGLAYVINDDPDPDLEDEIQEAIDSCPTGCIHWEDE